MPVDRGSSNNMKPEVRNLLLTIVLVLMIIPLAAAQPKDRIPPGKQKDIFTEPSETSEPEVIYVNQTVPTTQEEGVNWEMVGVIIVVMGGLAGWILSRLGRS